MFTLYATTPNYTCPTCHELSGWLKVLAQWNMSLMLVTSETSHASMSSSKLDLRSTRPLMSVTAPTSQAEIGPNRSRADVALLIHAARASSNKSPLLRGVELYYYYTYE